jgi:hypothetical protein
MEYANKMVDAINKGGNGSNFSKITEYQKLKKDVLSYMVENIKPNDKLKDSITNHFLIDNIELMTKEDYIEDIYEIIIKGWRPYSVIARMDLSYQKKYAETLERMDQVLEFFKCSTLSQDEKAAIVGKFI